MKVVVTGAGGMLAQALLPELAERGHTTASAMHEALDVTRLADVRAFAKKSMPDWIVNCAAYTDVDGCESAPDRAFVVNGLGARNCAEVAYELGAGVLAMSSDYVFDGRGAEPRREHDIPGPLNVYGRSKLAGERGAREVNPRHIVVRTSWLFGRGGRNFVDTILTRARAGEKLSVVNDQRGSPTWTRDLARALVLLMERGEYGTYHVTNSGDCTWYEFAQEICAQAGVRADLTPIRSDELARPARRPAYSVLHNAWFAHVAGGRLPHWREALKGHLEHVRSMPAKEA